MNHRHARVCSSRCFTGLRLLLTASTLAWIVGTLEPAAAQQTSDFRTYGRMEYFGGRGVNYQDNFARFGLFSPKWLGETLGFAQLDGSITDEGDPMANVGAGFRRRLFGESTYWGANFFYDVDGRNGFTFQQVGVGTELIGNGWDARLNIYTPIGDRQKTVRFGPTSNVPHFGGYDILFDRTRFDKIAADGVDLTVGALLPGWLGEHGVKGSVGWYHFSAPHTSNIDGIRGTLEAFVTRNVQALVGLQHDDVFQTSAFFGISWRFPGGSQRGGAPSNTCAYAWLGQPAQRNTQIVVRDAAIPDPVVAINADTGLAFHVIHVNSAATPGGNGTLEHPFDTLPGAQGGSAPDDIVFAHADSVFSNQGIALQSGQRFLGEANGFDHLINTQQFGVMNLPRATAGVAAPVIQNAPGGSGAAVVLAPNTEVSVFNINGGQAGISGGNFAGDVNINRTTIANTVVGIGLADVAGTVDMTGVSIQDCAVGLNIANASGAVNFVDGAITGSIVGSVAVDGGNADVTFSNTTISQTGGIAVLQISNNTGGNIQFLGGSITGTNTVDDGVLVVNSAANVTINNAALSSNSGNGVRLLGNTGAFTFNGGSITNFHGDDAVRISGGNSDITFQGTTITQTGGGNVLDIENTTGGTIQFLGGSVQGTSTVGSGVFVVNATADIVIENLNVQGSGADGMTLGNLSGGSLTVNGGAIANSNQAAIALINSSQPVTFNNVDITGTNAVGLYVDNNSGNVLFDGGQISGSGVSAVEILNGSGNTTLATTINFNASGTGIVVQDTTAGLVDFFSSSVILTGANGIQVQNSAGDVSFGTVDVNTGSPVGRGVLVNANSGNVSFDTLNITTSAGDGLVIVNSPGLTTINGGFVDAAGSIPNAGVQVINSQVLVTLQSVSATTLSSLVGIILQDMTGSFTVTGVGATLGSGGQVGSVQIINSQNVAINLLDTNDPNDSASEGVLIQGSSNVTLDSLRVAVPQALGIRVNGSTGVTIANCQITDPDGTSSRGILVETTDGVTTAAPVSVTIDANTITLTDPASTGIVVRAINANVNLSGTLNNTVTAPTDFSSTTSGGGVINGTILVNGVPRP